MVRRLGVVVDARAQIPSPGSRVMSPWRVSIRCLSEQGDAERGAGGPRISQAGIGPHGRDIVDQPRIRDIIAYVLGELLHVDRRDALIPDPQGAGQHALWGLPK